jgi:hypothetical protein
MRTVTEVNQELFHAIYDVYVFPQAISCLNLHATEWIRIWIPLFRLTWPRAKLNVIKYQIHMLRTLRDPEDDHRFKEFS